MARVQEASLWDSMKSPLWWGPIILMIGGIIAIAWYKNSRNSLSEGFAFRGTVLYAEGGNMSKTGEQMDKVRGSRTKGVIGLAGLVISLFGDPVSATLYVEDESNPDNTIAWPISERAVEYFQWDDYVVKEAGQPAAVFREGRQLTQVPFFLSTKIEENRGITAPKDRPAREVAEAETTFDDDWDQEVETESTQVAAAPVSSGDPFAELEAAPMPAVAQNTTMAQQPVGTEEDVARLLNQAGHLWQGGRPAEAVTCCEQALAIRQRLYAANDARVLELVERVAVARQMLTRQ